ncbi:cytochrome c biogenesis protein CcdA [Desulfogranum marinum]|uniref:cytochrome c biogenesis protein CcdA n=1 Tax=Desulfogranum marinum TaxID=453220 RepID=UPI0019649471|nr:cytochrome c biogenesis protein CcdA [Desulfogranum marinum]MBM9514423.1 sulfite exporter TauE/SafE family protein [Desulfogranum marinum]
MEHFLSQLETTLQTSLLLSIGIAYLGGLLASLTPCIYPMIPITAGVVGHSNIGGSRARGFLLSVTYVFGMAITYAGLGIFAAATGRFFGTVNSHPLTFLLVGNIILLFGLGMLDVFTMPYFSHNITAKTKGFFGVFFAGILSAFVAGPCTAPVLGVLLAYVATTQNILTGGLLLFIFSFGMGTILIGVGTFSSILAAIPKSGSWMATIKKAMGFIMIALAEYFFIKAGMLFI